MKQNQLGNEANANPFGGKTWKPRQDELGPQPGLWLPGEHALPGVHPRGRRWRAAESVSKMSTDRTKLSQIQIALRFLFNTVIYLLLYVEKNWGRCVFTSITVCLYQEKNDTDRKPEQRHKWKNKGCLTLQSSETKGLFWQHEKYRPLPRPASSSRTSYLPAGIFAFS